MLEDQVKEAEYYKTMLEFRKGKKGLRTSKLFFFRDDLSSPPTVSNLLEKLERMFFSYQEVEERNFEGNGSCSSDRICGSNINIKKARPSKPRSNTSIN